MSLFFLTVFCLIGIGESQYDGTTLTGAYGPAVTTAAIRAVQDTCIFSNDRQLMRRLAWVATSFGDELSAFVNNVGGLWRLSEAAFNRTKDPTWYSHRYGPILTSLKSELGIDYQKMDWRSGALLVPIQAAIAERMYIESLSLTIPYQADLQAQLWPQYFEGDMNVTQEEFIEDVAQIPNVCRSTGADVLFLMDSSGSITSPNWRIMQDFVISVVGQFPIGPAAYKFAVDVFNDNAESLITFNAYQNISTLQQLINVLPYVQGNTRTDLALVNAVTNSFTPQSGVRDPSLGFPKVAILITDGLSTYPNRTRAAADLAKQVGIVLITIGIANADVQELTYVASEPKCMRTYILDSFGALSQGFPAELMAQTCQTDALLTPNDTGIAGTLQRDQYLYFYVQLNSTTGVTYQVNATEGAVTLYLSSTVPQPDEARYDYAINATVDSNGLLTISPNLLMPGVDKSVVDDLFAAYNWSTTLYGSIRGTGDNNNFTLSIEEQAARNGTSQAVSATTTVAVVQAGAPVSTIIIAVVAGILLLCLVVGGILIYYMRYVRYTVNPNESDQSQP